VHDGSDQRGGFWRTIETGGFSIHERIGPIRDERHSIEARRNDTQLEGENAGEVMQRAALVLDIRNTVAMIAVPPRRAMIVADGNGLCALEDMQDVVEHDRHDASRLGDQKEPKQPGTKAPQSD
jgi:hypothetical protein